MLRFARPRCPRHRPSPPFARSSRCRALEPSNRAARRLHVARAKARLERQCTRGAVRARLRVHPRPLVEREGDHVIACVASSPRRCTDVVWADCAARDRPPCRRWAARPHRHRRGGRMILRIEDDMKRDAHVRCCAEARGLARAERHVQRRGARMRRRARRAHGLLRAAGRRRRAGPERRRDEEPARRRDPRSRARSRHREPGREHEDRSRGARAAAACKVLVVFPEARRRRHRPPCSARARSSGSRAIPNVRDLLRRGYDVVREAEAARKPRRAAADVLSDLDEAADDDQRRDVHQRHARSRGRAERVRRSRAPVSARRRSRQGDAASARATSPVATRATRASRSKRSRRARPSSCSCPTSRTRSPRRTRRSFARWRSRRRRAARSCARTARIFCWYGARTIEGLPRVRALVERCGRRAVAYRG